MTNKVIPAEGWPGGVVACHVPTDAEAFEALRQLAWAATRKVAEIERSHLEAVKEATPVVPEGGLK